MGGLVDLCSSMLRPCDPTDQFRTRYVTRPKSPPVAKCRSTPRILRGRHVFFASRRPATSSLIEVKEVSVVPWNASARVVPPWKKGSFRTDPVDFAVPRSTSNHGLPFKVCFRYAVVPVGTCSCGDLMKLRVMNMNKERLDDWCSSNMTPQASWHLPEPCQRWIASGVLRIVLHRAVRRSAPLAWGARGVAALLRVRHRELRASRSQALGVTWGTQGGSRSPPPKKQLPDPLNH